MNHHVDFSYCFFNCMTTAWTGAVAPHVYYVQSTKGQKVTLRPNNLHHFVSAAEIAVVIRLRLSKTRKSGKMQTSLRILLV